MRALAISLLVFVLSGCWLSHTKPETAREPELASSASLAIDDAFLYWADPGRGSIVRAPRGGGEIEVLAAASPALYTPIAITSDELFWVDARDAIQVWRVPIGATSGASERVALGNAGPIGITADAEHVYFSSYEETFDLLVVDLDTGARRVIESGPAALGLVVDGTDLIGTSCAVPGVWRIPRGGGERTLLTEAYCPITISLHGDDVYFSDYAEPTSPGVGGMGIFRAPASGGPATRVTITDTLAFAVHRGFVYTTLEGSLVQVARDGSTVELAPAGEAIGVAVDDDFVYWTETTASGQVDLQLAPLP